MALCLAIMCSAQYVSRTKYEQAYSDHRRNLSNVASALGEYTGRAFGAVALTQEDIARYLQESKATSRTALSQHLLGTEIHSVLRHQLSGHPQIHGFMIADVDGIVVNVSRTSPALGTEIVSRDYVQALRDNPKSENIIAEPVQSLSDDRRLLYLARKILSEDGEFIGAVVAVLDMAFFEEAFSKIDLDRSNAIGLFRTDGTLLARLPSVQARGKKYDQAVKALGKDDRAFAIIVSRIDGAKRWLAVQRVRDVPLAVAVGIDQEEALSQWQQDFWLLWSLAGFACLTTGSIIFFVMRALLRMRRKDEELADRQKQHLDITLNHMSHGLANFDNEERLVLWNARLEQIYRLGPDSLKAGMTLTEILQLVKASGTFVEDPHQYALELRRHFATGREHRRDKVLSDGRVIQCINRQIPGGGWVSTHEDITAVYKSREAMKRSQAFLNSIVTHVPVSILVKDAKTLRYVLTNRTSEDQLGRRQEMITGKTAEDHLPPHTAALITAADRQALMSRSAREDEYTVEAGSKGERRVHVKRVPILDDDGEPLYLLAVVDDVTDRRADEAMRRHAQKMEAVASLSGGMAHDFNNLLLVMIGNLDLLAEQLEDRPDALEKVAAVLDASLRGAELTRQMLAFSRRQPLQPRNVDVNAMVTETCQLLRRTLGDEITVRLSFSKETLSACVDEGQLQAAIVNIAVNARDAMPNGGEMTVSTRSATVTRSTPDLLKGNYVVIEVTDTGEGMPQQVLSRIFEPFYTTKPLGKGTGLGLSMVYGFTRQSGGGVTVDSSPGKGTSIALYLPIAKSGEATVPTKPASLVGGQSRTVLIVDDNEAGRATVRLQLQHLGYKVCEAATPEEALAVLASGEAIDLLLSDVLMPGMRGDALAGRARQIRPHLRVLLMSGFPDVSQGLPDEKLIRKPFRKDELHRAILEVLDAPKAA